MEDAIRLGLIVFNVILAVICLGLGGKNLGGEDISRCDKDGCANTDAPLSSVHGGLTLFGYILSILASALMYLVLRGGLLPTYKRGAILMYLSSILFVSAGLGYYSLETNQLNTNDQFIPIHQAELSMEVILLLCIIVILFIETVTLEPMVTYLSNIGGGGGAKTYAGGAYADADVVLNEEDSD